MAMKELKVSPQQLKSKSDEFSTKASKVQSITNNMFSLIKQLNGAVWSGAAATAYTNQFNKLDDDCKKMYKMIKEFSDDLSDIANEYAAAERANESTSKSLKADVIA